MSHTPGPWNAEMDEDDESAVTDRANVRLIAAAPALLAACQHALEALQFIEADQHPEYERGWNEEISELEEAIAAAIGDNA